MSDLDGHQHFGVCPECGMNDGALSVGPNHWYVCHLHELRWYVGRNLFSGWRDISEADSYANRLVLERYEEIDPLHYVCNARVLTDLDCTSAA